MGTDASEQGEKRGKFYFRGGSLALDFTNTVGDRLHHDHPRDYFQNFSDVVDWARVAGIPISGGISSIEQPRQFRRALHIRELIYRILSSEAKGGSPSRQDLTEFGRLLKLSRQNRVLHREQTTDGVFYSWHFETSGDGVDALLSTILEDAASLLSSPEFLGRLRICADETCGWLFLDKSRPGKRRWCSMSDCGNRAKARRHYQRNQK